MPAPTLVSLCMKVCIKNIQMLTDVGDFEFWKIEPILKHVKSAEQLREIEVNCPQIKGEDAELWKKFIADVDPKWHLKNYVPKNPQKWYEIYRKYKREAEEKLRQDEEKLRNAMLGLNKEKESHTSQLVSSKALPKLPRDPRMRPNNGGVPIGKGGKGQRTVNDSVLSWGLGSKTKTTDGKSVMLRARREAKEMSMRNKLGVPANQLKGRSSFQQAPPSMVDNYRRAAIAPLRINAPKKNHHSTRIPPIEDAAQEARERRLRALTTWRPDQGAVLPRLVSDDDTSPDEGIGRRAVAKSTNTVKSTVISDDEDSGLDDLFDERPSPPKKQAMQASIRRAAPTIAPKKSTATKAKPSDLISSIVSGASKLCSSLASKPKPKAKTQEIPKSSTPGARPTGTQTPTPTPSKPTAAKVTNPISRSSSPAVPATATTKPLVRKRAPVDVFNRQAKKPRRT